MSALPGPLVGYNVYDEESVVLRLFGGSRPQRVVGEPYLRLMALATRKICGVAKTVYDIYSPT